MGDCKGQKGRRCMERETMFITVVYLHASLVAHLILYIYSYISLKNKHSFALPSPPGPIIAPSCTPRHMHPAPSPAQLICILYYISKQMWVRFISSLHYQILLQAFQAPQELLIHNGTNFPFFIGAWMHPMHSHQLWPWLAIFKQEYRTARGAFEGCHNVHLQCVCRETDQAHSFNVDSEPIGLC